MKTEAGSRCERCDGTWIFPLVIAQDSIAILESERRSVNGSEHGSDLPSIVCHALSTSSVTRRPGSGL